MVISKIGIIFTEHLKTYTMKKKLYKTIILIEVLSDEPIEDMTLTRIIDEGDTGSLSIRTIDKVNDKPIKGKQAIKALDEHGTDYAFFGMDEQGNEMED